MSVDFEDKTLNIPLTHLTIVISISRNGLLKSCARFVIERSEIRKKQHDFKSVHFECRMVLFYMIWEKSRLQSTFFPQNVEKDFIIYSRNLAYFVRPLALESLKSPHSNHTLSKGGQSMFFTPPLLSDQICKIVRPIFRKKSPPQAKKFRGPFFQKN